MGEIEKRQENMPAILDSYVQQGRMFLFNAAQNLIQYGRVLTEAKPLVPHGQFGSWVQENFGMSERTAQGYMAVWRRFGGNERFQTVQFSNLQKMLALPEGAETDFAKEHDLENMTAREVEKAVQQAKAAAQADIDRERAEADRLRRKVEKLESRKPETPGADLIAQKDLQIEELTSRVDAALKGKNRVEAELRTARQEISDMEEAMADAQQNYDRMQAELLNAQSTIARGDAERVIAEQLTAEDFAAACRAFLGSVAQMPYMASSFCQISDMREYRQWDEHLQAIEDFARKARKALTTGGIIDG